MATQQEIITAGQQKVQATRQAKASTLLTVKSDAQKRCEQQGGQFIGGKCVFKRKEAETVKAPLPEGTVTVGGRVVQTKEEPKTPEQIRLERDIEERIDPTKRTARISEDIGISPEDVAALTPEQKKTRLEEEVERVEKQAELTRQEVVERADIRREQIGRGVSAFKSAFAVSRGGVLANVGLGAGIAKAATAQLQTIDRNIEQFELQQESSRERLEDARRKGLTSIVKSESERLSRIQTELLKEQTKFSEQEEGVRTKALEAIDFLDSLSAASIAGFDETEISQLFQQAGLPSFAASAFISENLKLSEAEAELAKDPENVEKRNRVLALQGKVSQIKTEIGKTTKVEQEIAGFQRLLDTNVITQDQFDQAVSGQIGLETPKERSARLKTEAETRKINLKNTKTVKGGASNGAGKIDPVSLIKDFDFGNGQAGASVLDSEGNVVGRVTSSFGADHSQVSGEKEHNGIDVVFNKGEVPAMQTSVVVKKGTADDTYGGYIWLQDSETGEIMQYGHMSPEAVSGVKLGQSFQSGEIIGTNATNSKDWGSATGAHTDIRLVGAGLSDLSADGENSLVSSWAYEILDGQSTISNVQNTDDQPSLRNDVLELVQKRRKEGYRSKYPVLTETQLKLVNQISDDFNNDKQVGDILDVQTGLDSINTVYGSDTKIATATGFEDITAINAFQRMIDPGATVREGDVTLLQSAVPWLSRVDPSFKWSQFKKGDKLPADTRKSLIKVATALYNEKAAKFNNTVGKRFQARSDAAGIPFNLVGQEFVIFDVATETTLREDTNASFDEELSGIEQEIAELEAQLAEEQSE